MQWRIHTTKDDTAIFHDRFTGLWKVAYQRRGKVGHKGAGACKSMLGNRKIQPNTKWQYAGEWGAEWSESGITTLARSIRLVCISRRWYFMGKVQKSYCQCALIFFSLMWLSLLALWLWCAVNISLSLFQSSSYSLEETTKFVSVKAVASYHIPSCQVLLLIIL